MTQVGRIIAGALAFVMAAAIVPIAAPAQDWTTIETDALETLRRYVRINTAVPPGDVSKAADLLQSILEREGIPVTRYESGPGRSIIVARLKGTGPAKPVMLLHHMDVVPADASRWNRDPFAADIVDGKLYGRGAFDMKGPGVAHLYAFIALKRKNVPLKRDVILMAVPDEEVGGGLGAAWMRQHHLEDIESEYILDEGGFGSRDLFTKDKLVFGISVAEKKILWLKLIAEGVAGHGSQPHDRNPNDRLTKALARLLSEPVTPTKFEVLETFRSRVGSLAANKFNNAIQSSTISLTSLRSGVGEPPKVNVIPSIAEATIDCRVLPGTSRDAWLKEIARRLGDPEIKIEVVYEGPDPVVTTQDSDFYRALERAVRARYPEAVVTPMIVPYGTDSNGFRPLGVKSYGFTPVIVPAESVASMHGDAEFIPVDALGPAIQILFEALLQIASDAPRAPLKAALEATFAELYKAGAFPGGTAGFALADGTSFGIAVGVSDRDAKTPMQPTDRLLMGSIGKTYVSALTLQLVKDGRIGLDDSIAKYLGSETWFSRLPNASKITVRRLMNHTSGLVRYELNPKFTADLTASPDNVWTPEDRLAYLFDAVPPFAPGEGWEYSDTNYIVLGMILERAGGAPYYQQLRARILAPLHLDRTIPVEGRRVPGLVQGYAGPNNPFGGTDAMIQDGKFAINPQFEWTGGGLATSAEDLAKWAKLLYGGSVLDPSLMDDLLDGVTAKLGPETKYGLGVIIRPTAHGVTYGHSGFMPGYQADMMYFPELKTAIAVQVNSSAPKSTGRALRAFLTDFAAIVARSTTK